MNPRTDVAHEIVSGTLVVQVLGRRSSDLFEPGPLPLPWGAGTTTAHLRTTYLGQGAGMLYGSIAGAVREHQIGYLRLSVDDSLGSICVTACEYIELPVGKSDHLRFAMFHLESRGPDARRAYQVAVHQLCTEATALARSAWDHFGLVPDRQEPRGRRVAATTLVRRVGGIPLRPLYDGERWSLATRLMWESASLTSTADFAPDEDDPLLLRDVVYLSSTWRALVLRDGFGFVYAPPIGTEQFEARAETLVRTVYSDLALLAKVQRLLMVDMARALSALEIDLVTTEELVDLSRRSFLLHSRIWTQDVSNHTHGNSLLRAAQRQLGTQELFERVTQDLAFVRDEVQDKETLERQRAQSRQIERQEALELRIRRLAALIVGASFAIGTLGINLRGITSGDGISLISAAAIVLTVAVAGYAVAYVLSKPANPESG